MRDYYNELMKLAVDDENAALQKAAEFLSEITKEASELEQQKTLVAQMYGYLSRKRNLAAHVSTATVGIPIPVVIPQVDRSQEVRNAVFTLVEAGNQTLTTQVVQGLLVREGVNLGVQQPLAVIGTIMNGMTELQKVAENTYRWIGVQQQE